MNQQNNNEVYAEKPYETNDMSFSAYLILNGMELLKAKKLGNSFKFTFKPMREISGLEISYINSDIAKYDDIVRKLKKIVFGNNGNGRH